METTTTTPSSVHAFIAFLNCEASQAEERAKSLRNTAAVIEANNKDSAATGECPMLQVVFVGEERGL